MEFKKAEIADIRNIMQIIEQAQRYFKENGINQWQNNYPNLEIIEKDIKYNYGYVLADGSGLVGTVALSFDGDKNYEAIYDGNWLSSGAYAVIHRIAVEGSLKGRGLASLMVSNIEGICLERNVHSIRVDTHRENLSMQNLLQKNDFIYCGIIYLEDGSERLAFEKVI